MCSKETKVWSPRSEPQAAYSILYVSSVLPRSSFFQFTSASVFEDGPFKAGTKQLCRCHHRPWTLLWCRDDLLSSDRRTKWPTWKRIRNGTKWGDGKRRPPSILIFNAIQIAGKVGAWSDVNSIKTGTRHTNKKNRQSREPPNVSVWSHGSSCSVQHIASVPWTAMLISRCVNRQHNEKRRIFRITQKWILFVIKGISLLYCLYINRVKMTKYNNNLVFAWNVWMLIIPSATAHYAYACI